MRLLNKALLKIQVYLYYTAKPNLLNPIFYMRLIRESYSEYRIKKIDNGQLYEHLTTTIAKSKSTGCEYSDYLTIWNALNKFKPKNILECGSGISSIIYSYYISKLSDPKQVKFISMDSVDFWHQQIVEIFPKNLKEFVEFRLSERIESLYNGVLGCHYKDIPNLNYDFIFVDGPLLRKVWNDKKYPKCFNADIINIINSNTDIKINGLLDQRIGTLIELKKLMPSADIKYNPIKKVSYFNCIENSNLTQNLNIKKV